MREIVVHLGFPKTGSTAIQYALASERYALDGVRLAYPARFNHLPLANALSIAKQRDKADPRFAAVADLISEAKADIAVVSAELFEVVDPAALKVMIDRHFGPLGTSLRLIAYVRPHIDRVLAAHTERTKAGRLAIDTAEFFGRVRKNREFLYAPMLDRWRESFGTALTVRPFLRSELSGGDVVRDFLEYVVGPERLTSVEPQNGNESLSREQLAMLREFHLRTRDCPVIDKIRPAVGWHLAMGMGKYPAPGATKRQVDADLARQIADWYADDAARLDGEYFGKPLMQEALADGIRKAAPAPQSIVAAEIFDADELARLHGWIEFSAELIRLSPKKFGQHFRRQEEEVMLGGEEA